MIHRFVGGHEGPKSDLFLQYLSTGQFECARLMFQQVMQEGDDASKAKLKRQAALVACGLRPAEWAPTTSLPSSAHLAWQCRRLVEVAQDITIPVDMFLLASSSLSLEAGIDFDDHSSMPPSDKIKMIISGHLANRERLCQILQGPSNLTCIVWSTLEQHMSESDASEILSLVTEALSQSNRDLDAVRLFAHSRQVLTAPDLLAKRVSNSDALALQALCILLTAQPMDDGWVNDLGWIKSKHASVCRFRGDSLTTVETAILRGFRQDQWTDWLEILINDPFKLMDVPDALRALNLLTSTSDPSWSGRLFQVQDSIIMKKNRQSASNTRSTIDEQQKQMGQKRNEFAQCVHDRVNRLGFCSIVSETLCGAADVQAARLSHNLRGKTISDVLLYAIPPFDAEKVRDVGKLLAPGPGSLRNEQIQLNVIRCAVWLDALKQAENNNDDDEEEENSCLINYTTLYLDGLTALDDLISVGYFWLERGLFVMHNVPCALKVTRCIRSTIQSRHISVDNDKLINSFLEVESRLEICEIAMSGDILEVMKSSPWIIYTKCMDNREYQLAMTFSKAIGKQEWFKQAQIGLELQDDENGGSPVLNDAIAKADYCIMRGINNHVELDDPDLEDRVQMLMQKSRSFTPNVSEESFLASFPAKAYMDFTFDKESIFASQSSLRDFLSNAFRGGPIVSNFLQVLLELSTTLNMTPQQIFDLGLWGGICEAALRDLNGRSISMDLMHKVGLDLRRILLLCRGEYSSTRSLEFWDALDAIESSIPIERAIGGPVLGLIFGQDSNQANDDRHYQTFQILTGRMDFGQSQRRRQHAGSEFSLDSNDDIHRDSSSHPTATATTQDQIERVVDRVHHVVAQGKQLEKADWLSMTIARRSCDIWSLLASIKSKQITPQMAFEKLITSNKSAMADEALGEIAALLVGLQVDESRELVLEESLDDMDGEKASTLLGMIGDETAKSMWIQKIVDALRQSIVAHPHLQSLFLRTISTIQTICLNTM